MKTVFEMAREADLKHVELFGGKMFHNLWLPDLERFAAIVAAAEREAIAQSLDKQADLAADEIDRQWAQEMAAAVRARGEKT